MRPDWRQTESDSASQSEHGSANGAISRENPSSRLARGPRGLYRPRAGLPQNTIGQVAINAVAQALVGGHQASSLQSIAVGILVDALVVHRLAASEARLA